jgi:hypothetical protein
MKTIARISGFGYLAIFISGFYANFAVVENLIDLSDATKTYQNISEDPSQLFYGILGFVVMIFFDAVLVWTLYLLLKGVNKRVSQLASLFRFVNVLFFGVALYNLILAYSIIAQPVVESINAEMKIMGLVQNFDKIWIIGLIFFGIHLALLGYLIIKSAFIPNWLGILLMLASAGYIIDGFANLYLPSYENYQQVFMLIVVIPGVVGEFSFTLWLLLKRKFEENK